MAKYFRYAIVALVLVSSTIFADETIPQLHQRVTDYTNTLTYQEWRMLEKILKEFEDSTSTQIAVLMVNSLENENIEEYAYKVFHQNQIGQEGKNNGVLLVIAKDNHQMRIEVGYGLEGVLTDAVASRIIRNEIVPNFKEGNYFAGLVTGIDAIMRATAGEYKADNVASQQSAGILWIIIFVLLILAALYSRYAMARQKHVIGGANSYYYSGWGYGGGHRTSGGGFGGGSWSGGGGFSGGGGATGSW
jgi:uncharacterized protein